MSKTETDQTGRGQGSGVGDRRSGIKKRGEALTPDPQSPTPGKALSALLWRLPLGWQLSLLYTLALAATLALVGAVVYSQQQDFLVQDAAQRLEQEVARIAALPTPPPHPGGTEQNRPEERLDQPTPTTSQAQSRLVSNLVRGLTAPGVVVAVLDTQGNVITTTTALEGDDPPVAEPVTPDRAATALQTDQTVRWIVEREGGGRQVVVLKSLTWKPPPGAGGEPVTLLVEQTASLSA